MKSRIAWLLSLVTWLLVAGSIVIIAGGIVGRPLLMAAVPTGSMVPNLNPGDLIMVLPTWVMPEPEVGRIVVYRLPGQREWVVHRIVEGDAVHGFVTKGDANPVPDPDPVMPGDIAGIVPSWGGAAVRLPRLGLLSIEKGPFSSPVVAGVALVMGIFLLFLDRQRDGKGARLGSHRRRAPARPEGVFHLYLGLAATVFLTTLVPAWSLSGRQPIQYEFVSERPANVKTSGQYLIGRANVQDVALENPAYVPVLVMFVPQGAALQYEPAWKVIPPKGVAQFHVTVTGDEPGIYRSTLQVGVLTPLLPPVLLVALARISLVLAVVVNALVPTAIIVAIAVWDLRSRLVMRRMRNRFYLRWTH